MNDLGIISLLPFLIPVFLLEIGLMVWALVDISKRERVKGNNKVVWILVVVLINLIGPIVYFLFGREEAPVEEE
jgi:hypothetical protein